MNICLIEKGIAEINLIKPLWEQLNSIHIEKSVYFKSNYENFTFEERLESIYRKAQDGNIKLDLLLDKNTKKYIGYCLSSIKDNLGEIESLFIEKDYRKLKLGDKLMRNALSCYLLWFGRWLYE